MSDDDIIVDEDGNTTVVVTPGVFNINPTVTLLNAQDFFKCYLDFQSSRKQSLVPFFLCCRAIELGLKSIHLEKKTKNEVRKEYGHNLICLYSELPSNRIDLSNDELLLLIEANELYKTKQFEDFLTVQHIMQSYDTAFPNLTSLAELARKVTRYGGWLGGRAAERVAVTLAQLDCA